MGAQHLQIGQVARKTGLSVDAIRFYEKTGLLPRPDRSAGGYRLYDGREVADLEFIRKAQQLGFSLKEIRDLISIQREPRDACAQVQDLIAQKLAVVRGKIQELKTIEAGLAEALERCRKAVRQGDTYGQSCPALQEIAMARVQSKEA